MEFTLETELSLSRSSIITALQRRPPWDRTDDLDQDLTGPAAYFPDTESGLCLEDRAWHMWHKNSDTVPGTDRGPWGPKQAD